MPCSDGNYGREVVYQIDPTQAKEIKRLEARLDEVTRLLCLAGRYHYGIEDTLSAELEAWWKAHRKVDEGRGVEWI